VSIRNMPWQAPGLSKSVGVAALECNMLCDRHNPALSVVDDVALRLFRALRRVERALTGPLTSDSSSVTLFNGFDIERWLLKTLIGLATAGATRTLEGERIQRVIPEIWIRILFGEVSFPKTWGLYVRGDVGHVIALLPGEIMFAPVTVDNTLVGLTSYLVGQELTLLMCDVPTQRGGAVDGESVHRPAGLCFVEPQTRAEHSLSLVWHGHPVGPQVRMDMKCARAM
jgi:hypothetical protein